MISIKLPIRLKSSANISEHWAVKLKRQKKEKLLVKFALNAIDLSQVTQIKLIRHAPRQLDDDNLAYAFKHIRDCVADLIIPGLAPGRADSRLSFLCSQERSRTYFIEIALLSGTSHNQSPML